ncbi:MAG TPA: hypothetical protein VE075_04280, partial [Thermoanaerobaculia bacterium]|nr:hypothetical protein [Thermoanaerobaculia bacterium]
MNRCGSHVGRWTLIGGVLLLAVAGRAHGGVGRWTALGGPSGGKVNWMAVDPADPRRLFAVTDAAGLFRSTNGGMTWEPAPGLPSKTRGYVVAIDPRRPRTVYVGLGPAQAWKSVDGGDSWTPLAGGPFDGQLLSLTFAPRHPRTVYALSYGASKLRVFRSADGGTTWGARGVFSGGQSYGLTPIVVSPFDANMLLLDALFSTDGGLSWTFLSPNAMTGDTLHRVLFEPLQSGVVLYAAVNVGIFRSADGGRTWTEVTPGHATAYYLVENMAFSFDGRTLFVVASGPSGTILQESDDGGLHWTPSTAPAPFGLGQFLEGSIIADPAGG